jgi:hypothetical protein
MQNGTLMVKDQKTGEQKAMTVEELQHGLRG